MKIEMMKLSAITPYLNNPRKNDDAIDKVVESIKKLGFNQPIVVDRKKVIIVGHTRWKAALKMNLKSVPVLVARGLTKKQAQEYRIADNRTSEMSEWDFQKLNQEIGVMVEANINIDWMEFESALNFKPDLNPNVGSGVVTAGDMEKADDDLQNQYKIKYGKDYKPATFIECPFCHKEFGLDENVKIKLTEEQMRLIAKALGQ